MKNTEILNTAFEIVVDEGIEKLSMRKIANEVGCTPSTLYHYFTDKNDLLNQLILYVDQRIMDEFWQEDLNLREIISTMFSTNQQYLRYQKFLRTSYGASFITEDTHSVIRSRIEERKKVWVNFREQGVIRDDVDKRTMHIIFWGISQMIAQDNSINETTRENLTEVIYRGISGHNSDSEDEVHKNHRRILKRRQVRRRIKKANRRR